jgi:tetratricopeptide (TPR) repeat protein
VRFLLPLLIAAAPAGASGFSTATVDALYFSRDLPGNLEKTVAMLAAQREREPKNPEVLWRLGRSLVRVGEKETVRNKKLAAFKRAMGHIEAAIELDDANPDSHFWHGIALGRRGQTKGIMRSLFMIRPMKRRMRRVLELDPKHSGAHHVLGEMYRQLPGFAGGSRTRAVAELEKALELGPDHTSHYPALAEAYIAAGRKEDAIRVLKALDSVEKPFDPPEASGHREDARRLLESLVSR